MDKVRLRGSKSFNAVDSVIEALRDYVLRVEELLRTIDRHKSRSFFVGYIFGTSGFFVVVVGKYLQAILERMDNSFFLLLVAFLVFTAGGFVWLSLSAANRGRQYKQELEFALIRLEELVRHASQIKDHMELEQLDKLNLEFRLREAESILLHAKRGLFKKK